MTDQLQDARRQLTELADILGVERSTPNYLGRPLQDAARRLQHELLSYRIAMEHQITDPDDLTLIRDFEQEAAMRRAAARLAATRITRAR